MSVGFLSFDAFFYIVSDLHIECGELIEFALSHVSHLQGRVFRIDETGRKGPVGWL
jgi:hypothetical protein